MKLYLFDTINRFKRYSETLDIKTKICNRPWIVFNDGGEREVYKFKEDGTINIVLSGRVTRGTWEYDPTDKTIIISASKQSYMVHPGMYDDMLLALQVDGTNQCSFLIEENNRKNFAPKTYSDLMLFFEEKEIEYENNIGKIERQINSEEELEQMIISNFLLFINDKPLFKIHNYIIKKEIMGCNSYFLIIISFLIAAVIQIIFDFPRTYYNLIIYFLLFLFLIVSFIDILITFIYSNKFVNEFIKTSPYKDKIDYTLRVKLEEMCYKD